MVKLLHPTSQDFLHSVQNTIFLMQIAQTKSLPQLAKGVTCSRVVFQNQLWQRDERDAKLWRKIEQSVRPVGRAFLPGYKRTDRAPTEKQQLNFRVASSARQMERDTPVFPGGGRPPRASFTLACIR